MFIYIFSTFKIDSNDPLCNFAKGFEDFLQIPLQPLMDNLGNRLVLYVKYWHQVNCMIIISINKALRIRLKYLYQDSTLHLFSIKLTT